MDLSIIDSNYTEITGRIHIHEKIFKEIKEEWAYNHGYSPNTYLILRVFRKDAGTIIVKYLAANGCYGETMLLKGAWCYLH